jgi:hypothetical protein
MKPFVMIFLLLLVRGKELGMLRKRLLVTFISSYKVTSVIVYWNNEGGLE